MRFLVLELCNFCLLWHLRSIRNIHQSMAYTSLDDNLLPHSHDLQVDYEEAIFLWRVDKKDFLLWTITSISTLFLGIEIGVLIGVSTWCCYIGTLRDIWIVANAPDIDLWRCLWSIAIDLLVSKCSHLTSTDKKSETIAFTFNIKSCFW